MIRGNHIDTVTNNTSSTSGAEGLYVKARFGRIAENTLIDCGRSTNGALCVKDAGRGVTTSGVQGYGLIVAHNMLLPGSLGTACRGIYLAASDVLVTSNYVEGLRYPIDLGNATSDTFDNVGIHDNEIRDCRGSQAISVDNAGTGLSVRGNRIYGILADATTIANAVGIAVLCEVGDYNDVVVESNLIVDEDESSATTSVRAIYIECSDANSRFLGLTLRSNTCSVVETSINAYGLIFGIAATIDPAIVNLSISGNDTGRLSGLATFPFYCTVANWAKISLARMTDNTFPDHGPLALTGDTTLTTAMSGMWFSNDGALDGDSDPNEITVTLPDTTLGCHFGFCAIDANDVRIEPAGTDAFLGGSGAGKYLRLDDVGCTVDIWGAVEGYWSIRSGFDPNMAGEDPFKWE